jgi:hypothetical protein
MVQSAIQGGLEQTLRGAIGAPLSSPALRLIWAERTSWRQMWLCFGNSTHTFAITGSWTREGGWVGASWYWTMTYAGLDLIVIRQAVCKVMSEAIAQIQEVISCNCVISWCILLVQKARQHILYQRGPN